MPSSTVGLHIGSEKILWTATIPLLDLESAINKDIDSPTPELYAYMKDHINATSTGQIWQTTIQNISRSSNVDSIVGWYDTIIVTFILTPSSLAQLRDFIFQYDVVISQVVTHKAIVSIIEDWNNWIHTELSPVQIWVIEIDTMNNSLSTLHIKQDAGSIWKWFIGMVSLWMVHIQEGYDHILFLLVLLVITPLIAINQKWSYRSGIRYTINRFLSISIAFTIGHSVALCIGAFGLIVINSQYIEILIAVTIFISAINVLAPIFNNKEVHIALWFWLIHGMAFSFSIASLDLSIPIRFLSILWFNIWIEAMQLIIMILFFPIIFLSRYKIYRILRIIVSVSVIVLSIIWIWQRILSILH
jgi:hypothetical protein